MQRNVTIIAIYLMFKNEYRVRSLNRRLYHSATAEGVVHRIYVHIRAHLLEEIKSIHHRICTRSVNFKFEASLSRV